MKSWFLATVLCTAAFAAPVRAAEIPAPIAHAVADATRPKVNTDSDALRNPAGTLAFAGVKPGMVIGELFPGGGYFTRMLSDVVGPKGKVYALETTRWKEAVELDQKMAAEPGRGNVVVSGTAFGEFSLPEKVDLVWITQNYHDLHIAEYGTVDMAAFNRHVFESLAMNARIALHVRVLYGRDPHHITEAQYKAVARALRQAVESDPRVSGVPSTKGVL